MLETSDSLNNQAILLTADGSYKEAIACFVRAIIIDKNNSLLWFNLGITYRDCGNLEQAKLALKKAHKLDPDSEDIIEELAIICIMQKNYDESMMFCREGILLNDCNPKFWNTIGVCEFNKYNYESACEAFENAVILNPYYEDAIFNLRDTYEKLGNKKGYAECNARLKDLK